VEEEGLEEGKKRCGRKRRRMVRRGQEEWDME
jgi:hypothetical protein